MFIDTYTLLKNKIFTHWKDWRHRIWGLSCQSRIFCGKIAGKIFSIFRFTTQIWKLFESLLHYITRQMTPHFVSYTISYKFQVFSAHIRTFSEIQRPWSPSLGKFAIKIFQNFSISVFNFSFWHKPWGVIIAFLSCILN